MSREKSPLLFSGSLEVEMQGPLDARRSVKRLTDLTDANSFPYVYKGLDVFCEENGKWYTFMGEDKTSMSNWREEGSGGGTVDQTYNATSTNAQSGKAVAEAIASSGGNDILLVDVWRPYDEEASAETDYESEIYRAELSVTPEEIIAATRSGKVVLLRDHYDGATAESPSPKYNPYLYTLVVASDRWHHNDAPSGNYGYRLIFKEWNNNDYQASIIEANYYNGVTYRELTFVNNTTLSAYITQSIAEERQSTLRDYFEGAEYAEEGRGKVTFTSPDRKIPWETDPTDSTVFEGKDYGVHMYAWEDLEYENPFYHIDAELTSKTYVAEKIAEAMTDVDNEHFHPVTALPDPADEDTTKRPKENHEYILIEYEQDGTTIKSETHYLFYDGAYHQKSTGGVSLDGYATEQYVNDGLATKQDKLVGGLKGQVPVKVSAADGDMEWADVEDAFANQKKYVIGDYVNAITNFTNGVSETGVALHPYESRLFKIFHTVEGTATETICYVDERHSQTSTTPYVYHFEDLDTYGRSYTMDVSYNTVPRPNPNPQGIPPVIQVPQWTCDDTTVTKIEIYNATVTELIRTLPAGGSAGQVLVKQSAIDGDAAWGDAGSGGGTVDAYTKDETDTLLDEKASFNIATIPGGGGGDEISATVSQGTDRVNVNYYKGNELPDALNLNVGEDAFRIPTTGYVDSAVTDKTLAPSGWGVAKTGVATVTFNNSKWSSSATVNVSEFGFSSGADYEVVAQPTTGGTATPWGNAIAFVNADKGASSFSVSSVTMEESLSGTVNVKYTIFAKGYGAVAYTGEIPTGGTTGQVLAKRSNADGDHGWQTLGAFTQEGDWWYKINPDKTFDAFYSKTGVSLTIQENSGNFYRSALQTLTLPTGITGDYSATPLHASVNTSHNNYPCFGTLASVATNQVKYYALSGSSRGASPNYIVTAHVFGTLTE